MSDGAIRWLDLDALMNEPPPPVPWTVEPLLARGAVTLLSGAHGVGKSLLAISLAAAVAHDAPHVAGMEVIGGTVAILDAENGERTLHERAHLAGLPAGRVLAGLAETFDLRHPQSVRELHEAIAAQPPALLVLDSLASLAPGLKENEADQVVPVLDRLRRLAQDTHAAVLLLHHARKDGDTYRGGTAIPAAADVVAIYARPRDTTDRERRVIDWSHERGGKMRLGPEPEPRHLRVAVAAGQLTIDAADPPSPDEAPPRSTAPTRRDQLAAQLVDVIAARGSLAQSDALRAIGEDPASQTGRRALQRAVDHGQLTRLDNGQYQALVSQGDNGDRQQALSGCQAGTPTGVPCPDNHHPTNAGTPELADQAQAEADRIAAKWGNEGADE